MQYINFDSQNNNKSKFIKIDNFNNTEYANNIKDYYKIIYMIISNILNMNF